MNALLRLLGPFAIHINHMKAKTKQCQILASQFLKPPSSAIENQDIPHTSPAQFPLVLKNRRNNNFRENTTNVLTVRKSKD